MTTMAQNPRFSVLKNNEAILTLGSPEGHIAHVFVLEQDIIRIIAHRRPTADKRAQS